MAIDLSAGWGGVYHMHGECITVEVDGISVHIVRDEEGVYVSLHASAFPSDYPLATASARYREVVVNGH